jgi:hypothetical protein
MRRRLAAALVVAALVAPAGAAAQGPPEVIAPEVTVGIAEPSPDIFEDPRFLDTGIRHARVLVPYDVVRAGGWPLAVADLWLQRARRDGVEPFVSFGHAMSERRRMRLPSVREYAARVREFRARYPWVREFSTWNEANLGSTQPTGRHPRRTATFYRALKKQCRDCTVVAVELLLTSNWRMWRWLRAFRERAGRGRLIFGLHNYPDVTRLRTRATRLFVRRVRNADIWITETGGIVRHRGFRHNERRAARAVRHAFRLTSSLPRIERLYLYNWRDDGNPRWDSGLIARDGTERRAYWELLGGLTLDRFRPAALGHGPVIGPVQGSPLITPVVPDEPEPPSPGEPD